MTTGYVALPAGVWTVPDANAPAASVVKGSAGTPTFYRAWAFDPATLESLYATFEMPGDYASGGTLSILWQSNDTGANENPIWACQVAAITAADADTPNEHAFNTAATVSDVVNTTEANRLIRSTITLTMDSAAAGDMITLRFYRDAAAGGDDLTSDALMIACTFSYTTT